MSPAAWGLLDAIGNKVGEATVDDAIALLSSLKPSDHRLFSVVIAFRPAFRLAPRRPGMPTDFESLTVKPPVGWLSSGAKS